MVALRDILPEPHERLAVVGTSGSGKTTLIKKLLAIDPDPVKIIVDSKPDDTWEPRQWWDTRKSQADKPVLLPHLRIRMLRPGTYVYRPEEPPYSDPRNAVLFSRVLRRGNLTIVFDELNDFANGSYVIPSVNKLFRQGRSKRVRILAGFQRPAQIPIGALSEITKAAVFALRRGEDRQRMAKDIHPALIAKPKQNQGHDFFFWNAAEDDELLRLIRQDKKRTGAG